MYDWLFERCEFNTWVFLTKLYHQLSHPIQIISPSSTFVSFLTVPVLFIHAVVSLDMFWTVHSNRVPTQSKILGMAVIEINSNSNLILLFIGVHVLPANLKEQEKRAFIFLKFPVSPERSKGLDPWVLYRCSGLKGWGSGLCWWLALLSMVTPALLPVPRTSTAQSSRSFQCCKCTLGVKIFHPTSPMAP